MKTKIYCVTYNNNEILNQWFLESLFSSLFPRDSVQVFIIDNHSNINIDPKYKDLITVIPNHLRPDFSTGHLSRSWNQIIINGFRDLDNPDCDVVIGCQVDTILQKNWYFVLGSLLEKTKYRYVTNGDGDQFQIFTVDSIKNIGLYDERFCSIGYQEADYFLRAKIFYGKFSSINDLAHGRKNNFIKETCIQKTINGCLRGDINHIMAYHQLNRNLFYHKWNIEAESRWDDSKNLSHLRPQINSYIYYPYFELKINKDTLEQQNYIL